MELAKNEIIDDIKNEVNWILLNGTTCGNDKQVDYFVSKGVISFFMDVIQDDDKFNDIIDALESIIVIVIILIWLYRKWVIRLLWRQVPRILI